MKQGTRSLNKLLFAFVILIILLINEDFRSGARDFYLRGFS